MCFYIDLAALAAAVALFVSLFLSLRRGRLVAFACFALVLRDCSRVSVCVAVWVCVYVCAHCLRACVTRMCVYVYGMSLFQLTK